MTFPRLTVVLVLLVLPLTARAGSGPELTLQGPYIETLVTTEANSVVRFIAPAGAPLQYCWTATAGSSGEAVASVRWGWQLIDPDDPEDPGWAIPVTAYDGSELCTDSRIFQQGAPNLVVRVLDAGGNLTQAALLIEIDQSVPVDPGSWGTLKARFGTNE